MLGLAVLFRSVCPLIVTVLHFSTTSSQVSALVFSALVSFEVGLSERERGVSLGPFRLELGNGYFFGLWARMTKGFRPFVGG